MACRIHRKIEMQKCFRNHKERPQGVEEPNKFEDCTPY